MALLYYLTYLTQAKVKFKVTVKYIWLTYIWFLIILTVKIIYTKFCDWIQFNY